MADIRSPVCTVVGHVDHGKSSILDYIRNSSIVKKEAGGITQAIGASIVPLKIIKKVCGALLDNLKTKFTIPGLLFIDTPGHAAFTNLRKRGGNLADIAILVIDINEGFMPQTIEAIEILKEYKTPFIIAANKIDLIHGWKTNKNSIITSISEQNPDVLTLFEKKMYELVGSLHEKFNINAERFDRVEDYTKQIAIIPTSAKTGEGIPELLMVVTGLAQKFLESCLKCDTKGDAVGTILEVKEEKGIGKTMDVIIYNGKLKTGDTIVIGGVNNPITTKVRSLFEPKPLAEMMDKTSRFKPVKEVIAATGVKISAPDIDEVVSGMPLRGSKKENLEKTRKEIQEEVEEVLIETDKQGIIIKADSLGSLEALNVLLKEKDIPVRKASIGNIEKKDISDAESSFEKDPLKSVILGFNVKQTEDAKSENVKVIIHNVIYKIIEDYEKWKQAQIKKQEEKELDTLVRPCKFELMRGYVFRQNNPAVCGADILAGKIKVGMPIMKDGKIISEVKSIQADKETLNQAEAGKQVAVSMENITVGRQINEGDILYSGVPEADFRKLKKLKSLLKKEEKEILKEIAKIMRKNYSVWGI